VSNDESESSLSKGLDVMPAERSVGISTSIMIRLRSQLKLETRMLTFVNAMGTPLSANLKSDDLAYAACHLSGSPERVIRAIFERLRSKPRTMNKSCKHW
jgi:hypothetical protein